MDAGKIIQLPGQAQRDPIYQSVPVQQIMTSPRYGIAEMIQEDTKKDIVLDLEQQIDELNQQQAAASASSVQMPQTSKKILTIPSSSPKIETTFTSPIMKTQIGHPVQMQTSVAGSSGDIKTVRSKKIQ
jgi:hypothetical protein